MLCAAECPAQWLVALSLRPSDGLQLCEHQYMTSQTLCGLVRRAGVVLWLLPSGMLLPCEQAHMTNQKLCGQVTQAEAFAETTVDIAVV